MIGKLVVCLVGVALFVFGAYQSGKRRRFIENGEETIAEVYGYQQHMNRTWEYVYAYTTLNGKRMVATENIYHKDRQRKRKAIGTKVSIVYNRENPTECMTKHQPGIMIGFYIMMAVGIMYMILGLFVIE